MSNTGNPIEEGSKALVLKSVLSIINQGRALKNHKTAEGIE